MKEREAQIKEWIAKATERHKEAAHEHALAQAKAQKVIDKAAEEAKQIVSKAAQAEKDAREDMQVQEKHLKVERREALTRGSSRPTNGRNNGYVPDEEILTHVYEAAVKICDRAEDGSFSQTGLVEQMKRDGVGMSSENLRPHVDYLRRHGIKLEDSEPVFRRVGKLRGGGWRLVLKERDQ